MGCAVCVTVLWRGCVAVIWYIKISFVSLFCVGVAVAYLIVSHLFVVGSSFRLFCILLKVHFLLSVVVGENSLFIYRYTLYAIVEASVAAVCQLKGKPFLIIYRCVPLSSESLSVSWVCQYCCACGFSMVCFRRRDNKKQGKMPLWHKLLTKKSTLKKYSICAKKMSKNIWQPIDCCDIIYKLWNMAWSVRLLR